VLIAWNAIVSHLLISFHILGRARAYIDVAAAQHFLPSSADQGDRIAMSSGKALVVLLLWTAVFMAAGRFWTSRRDA